MSIARFLLMLIIASLLIACGSAPAAPIALYPEAQPTAAGSVPMADALAGSFAQLLGGPNRLSAVTLYRVPDATTWADVKQFYTSQVSGTDWQPDAAALTEGDTFSFIGWTRGNQFFAVGFVDNTAGEGAYITTATVNR